MIERRQYPRVPVCYLSRLSGSGAQGPADDAVVLDLSVGGCRVHSTTQVHPGTEVYLQIALPNQLVPFAVERALVRWAREREFGVSFTSLRSEERESLRRLVSSARSGSAPLR